MSFNHCFEIDLGPGSLVIAHSASQSEPYNLTLTMSQGGRPFDSAIKDAEILLQHFDSASTRRPPENTEVLKRVDLVIALTAWETYVEDLAQELLRGCLAQTNDECLTKWVLGRSDSELQ